MTSKIVSTFDVLTERKKLTSHFNTANRFCRQNSFIRTTHMRSRLISLQLNGKLKKHGFQFQTRVLIICVHKLYQIVQINVGEKIEHKEFIKSKPLLVLLPFDYQFEQKKMRSFFSMGIATSKKT